MVDRRGIRHVVYPTSNLIKMKICPTTKSKQRLGCLSHGRKEAGNWEVEVGSNECKMKGDEASQVETLLALDFFFRYTLLETAS